MFTFFATTLFYAAFEFAYTLADNDLISHPIWSGLFGKPFPHHYILATIGLFATIALLLYWLWNNDI